MTIYHLRSFILLLVFCFSCQSSEAKRPKTVVFTDTAMTMDYRIIVGQPLSQNQKVFIQTLIKHTFQEIDTIYNKWNPLSELSTLNRLKAGETHSLSPELFEFLKKVDTLVRLTKGRFDPTIEPAQRLWKSYLNEGHIPPPSEIQKLKHSVGWDKISFEKGLFSKQADETCLDLGGIAKGLCVDLLVERLGAAGFPHVFVEWGGEIRSAGFHPEKRPWSIYISRLEDTDPSHGIAYLNLIDQAIATSGDYLQFWTITEGAKQTQYTHIFDSQTLSPLIVTKDSISSVSVMADSCVLADGLATAGLLFKTKDEFTQWAEEMSDIFPSLSFWMIHHIEQP